MFTISNITFNENDKLGVNNCNSLILKIKDPPNLRAHLLTFPTKNIKIANVHLKWINPYENKNPNGTGERDAIIVSFFRKSDKYCVVTI